VDFALAAEKKFGLTAGSAAGLAAISGYMDMQVVIRFNQVKLYYMEFIIQQCSVSSNWNVGLTVGYCPLTALQDFTCSLRAAHHLFY